MDVLQDSKPTSICQFKSNIYMVRDHLIQRPNSLYVTMLSIQLSSFKKGYQALTCSHHQTEQLQSYITLKPFHVSEPAYIEEGKKKLNNDKREQHPPVSYHPKVASHKNRKTSLTLFTSTEETS